MQNQVTHLRLKLMVVVSFLLPTVSGVQNSAANELTDGYYIVVCRESGLGLDVRGAEGEGAPIQVAQPGGQANREFRFVKVDDGYYEIRARHSGLPLAVTEGGRDLAVVITSDKASKEDKQFSIVAVPNTPYFNIVSRTSKRTFDVRGPKGGELAPVQTGGEGNQPNREFAIIPVSPAPPSGSGWQSKEVPAGEWYVLEWGVNTSVSAIFLHPAGAEVRGLYVTPNGDIVKLDGVNQKKVDVGGLFWQLAIKVPHTTTVYYQYPAGPVGMPVTLTFALPAPPSGLPDERIAGPEQRGTGALGTPVVVAESSLVEPRMEIPQLERPEMFPPGSEDVYSDTLDPIGALAAKGISFVVGEVANVGSWVRMARTIWSSDRRSAPSAEPADAAAEALNLNKSYGSLEQYGAPGIPIAGPGMKRAVDVADRLAKEKGGRAEDYVKMTSSSHRAPDGTQFQTHWYENIRTGQRYEEKTIIENKP